MLLNKAPEAVQSEHHLASLKILQLRDDSVHFGETCDRMRHASKGKCRGKTYGFISEFVLLSFLPKISSIMLSICVEDSSQVPSLSYKSNTKVSDRRQVQIKNKNIEIRTERNFVTQLIKT